MESKRKYKFPLKFNIFQLFFNNWQMKLFSLFSAFVLLLYVQATRTVVRELQIRVEKPAPPPGMIIASKIPSYINVELTGPSEYMDFQVSEIKMQLTNPGPREGENLYQVRLTPELPNGIIARHAKVVYVELDRILERNLPVDPQLNINLDPDLRIGVYRVEPPSIKVRGPMKIVEKMDRLRTDVIDVRGAPGEYRSRVFIKKLPNFVFLGENQPLDVLAEFTLIKEASPSFYDMIEGNRRELTLTAVPVRCQNQIGDYQVSARDEIRLLMDGPHGAEEPGDGDFEAQVYCYFDEDDKRGGEITLTYIPYRIISSNKQSPWQVKRMTPLRLNLNFKKSEKKGIVDKARKIFQKPGNE